MVAVNNSDSVSSASKDGQRPNAATGAEFVGVARYSMRLSMSWTSCMAPSAVFTREMPSLTFLS